MDTKLPRIGDVKPFSFEVLQIVGYAQGLSAVRISMCNGNNSVTVGWTWPATDGGAVRASLGPTNGINEM